MSETTPEDLVDEFRVQLTAAQARIRELEKQLAGRVDSALALATAQARIEQLEHAQRIVTPPPPADPPPRRNADVPPGEVDELLGLLGRPRELQERLRAIAARGKG